MNQQFSKSIFSRSSNRIINDFKKVHSSSEKIFSEKDIHRDHKINNISLTTYSLKSSLIVI